MQSKQTQRLAKRLRKAREHKDRKGNPALWRVVCMKVKPNIVKENGDPDTGLAYQIAYNEYEPSREIQKRLGMRETCKTCHRPFRKPSVREKVAPSKWRVWWNSLGYERQDKILARLYKIQELL